MFDIRLNPARAKWEEEVTSLTALLISPNQEGIFAAHELFSVLSTTVTRLQHSTHKSTFIKHTAVCVCVQ